MYEYIKGSYKGLSKDYIVVDNNGIGYKIHTSGSTIANVPKVDEEILVYVEQIVRQDFIGLYGFLTKEELDLFNLLLTINGVGAKAALSLLSISTVQNLRFAIGSGDEKLLIKAPGIGKKTAQRIILELKDKIKVISREASNVNLQKMENNYFNISYEASEALLSLGFSDKEVQQALDNVSMEDTLENIIKNCLLFLMN